MKKHSTSSNEGITTLDRISSLGSVVELDVEKVQRGRVSSLRGGTTIPMARKAMTVLDDSGDEDYASYRTEDYEEITTDCTDTKGRMMNTGLTRDYDQVRFHWTGWSLLL